MSSFAASVQRNQSVTTKKQIILQGTVKSAILDVSASFRTHLWSDPTLDSSGQTSLILQRQLRGYKNLYPTTKHQKSIPENLALHIYRQTNTDPNTAIGQLIAGTFFFGVRSCKYSTTPKGEYKRTRILQKGGMRSYRKRRELSHDSGILNLSDKVSLIFLTQKNGVKNATVTQWRTTTTLCPVGIWAEIIIQLGSYPGTMCDTPVNMVWVEHKKQQSPLK